MLKDPPSPRNRPAALKSANTPANTPNPQEFDNDANKTDDVNFHDCKFSASRQREITDPEVSSPAQATPHFKLRYRTSSPPNYKQRPRVLLVEDNAINLKVGFCLRTNFFYRLTNHQWQLLVTYMKRIHCDCVTASDGLQALEAYKKDMGRFDLVFMGK